VDLLLLACMTAGKYGRVTEAFRNGELLVLTVGLYSRRYQVLVGATIRVPRGPVKSRLEVLVHSVCSVLADCNSD